MLKVGDKIIKCSKVYNIFKIKKNKIANKIETIIQFKPYFTTEYNKTLILSIPLSCLDKTDIRLPFSKKELVKLFAKLARNLGAETVIDIYSAKETLRLNDPDKIVEVLRRLWLEKSDESISFTPSKEEAFKLAINKLTEEVAFVGNYSLKIAKSKMKKALRRNIYEKL